MYVLVCRGSLQRGERVVETFDCYVKAETISEALIQLRKDMEGAIQSCFAAALATEQRGLFDEQGGNHQ